MLEVEEHWFEVFPQNALVTLKRQEMILFKRQLDKSIKTTASEQMNIILD